MQANCPQCAQRIAIDDARVPDRAFSVKCPKCQTTVRFPGKTAAPSPATATPAPAAPPPAGESPDFASEPPPPAPEPPSPSVGDEMMRTQLMAQLRREMTTVAPDGHAGRALVALPDRALAGTVTVMLTRQGYAVDAIEDWDEAARLVEQGVYVLALTARTAPTPGKEMLFQRIGRLSPDNRRRIFLVLVGDEWKSGDGLQAFTVSADLVLNTREAGASDALIRTLVLERTRMYQAYLDARERHEAAAS